VLGLALKGKKTVEEQTKENDTWENHNNSGKKVLPNEIR